MQFNNHQSRLKKGKSSWPFACSRWSWWTNAETISDRSEVTHGPITIIGSRKRWRQPCSCSRWLACCRIRWSTIRFWQLQRLRKLRKCRPTTLDLTRTTVTLHSCASWNKLMKASSILNRGTLVQRWHLPIRTVTPSSLGLAQKQTKTSSKVSSVCSTCSIKRGWRTSFNSGYLSVPTLSWWSPSIRSITRTRFSIGNTLKRHFKCIIVELIYAESKEIAVSLLWTKNLHLKVRMMNLLENSKTKQNLTQWR